MTPDPTGSAAPTEASAYASNATDAGYVQHTASGDGGALGAALALLFIAMLLIRAAQWKDHP